MDRLLNNIALKRFIGNQLKFPGPVTFNVRMLGLLLVWCSSLQAQILKDTATFNMICRGVDYIYNLQSKQAGEIYTKIATRYPGHPMTFVYRGLMTYWNNYPLIPSSASRSSFEKDMLHAIALCEEKDYQGHEAEYLLINIGARGMLLLFYADNGLSRNVFSLASSTYQYIKQSFQYTQSYADFYFVTGLYRYYREAYPEAHPIYKPLALLFPKGDKALGLTDLQKAARNAIVLKAEAYSFLAGIYISFENNFQQASFYSKALHALYPRNPQYIAVNIKNLLLTKDYGVAEDLIKASRTRYDNPYFQAQLSIFNGILAEKKYRDHTTAQSFYFKGINGITPFGEFGDEYKAYAYFGLSRISEAKGDKQNMKSYRKKALELAAFKNVNFDP